jgi:hypothetical protein
MKRGEPRFCQGCGVNRRAKPQGRYCYDCMPGGPFTPPPCRRCASNENFFATGLCARCHLHGTIRVDACPDCHAWGATRTTKWLCWPCMNWRATHPTVGACITCRSVVTLSSAGVCRLCRVEARRRRQPKRPLDLAAASRYGAQLSFAGMHKKATRRRATITPQTVGPSRIEQPKRPVPHRQLVLFTIPRDLSRGRGVVGPPRDPVLARILDDALTAYAHTNNWDWRLTTKVRSGIRLVLGMQDTPGAAIAYSELAVLRQAHVPNSRVAEVLDATGMLVDDRTPAIDRWFAQQTAGLPAAMIGELGLWFGIMRHGSTRPPRRRPRNDNSIKSYVWATLPALRRWAAQGHESLRSITRTDILTALPQEPVRRKLYGQAMRSIFGILKSRRLVFANPAVRLNHSIDAPILPPNVDLDAVRAAFNSPDPAQAALVALVAFHGLRSHQLRNLLLADIRDRHLHLNGRAIPLPEPVRRRLGVWLDRRAQRWPAAINPHLFINRDSARHEGPVGIRWVFLTLGLPGGVQALRSDRILLEATATGGDARRLCDLFGLSIQQATRYTDAIAEPQLREHEVGHLMGNVD